MIIGICGHKLSGKDTIAEYLVDHHDFDRVGIADKIKEAVAVLWDIEPQHVELLKNNPTCVVVLSAESTNLQDYSMRQFLQRFGSEMGREVFGEYFWLDQAIPSDLDHTKKRIVVSDVRFPNEANRIRSLGGSLWRVFRDGTARDQHVSETLLDELQPDFGINNDGTLDDLYNNIEMVLESSERKYLEESRWHRS